MKASLRRPTVIEVDLLAVAANIDAVAATLPATTKLFSVVKANAYGHGVERIAPFIEQRVDGFCVSNLDEGIELRRLGIAKDILVLGSVPPAFVHEAILHDIILSATTQDWVDELESVKGLRVHIKVDSGMGRVGFRTRDAVDGAILSLLDKQVAVEGIFTHFATADQEDNRQFQQQLDFFRELLATLTVCPSCVHASNSAASLWHPEAAFNMVRIGDVQYGLNPSGRDLLPPIDLQPAMSLRSELVQVKTLPVGESIGYGGTYQTQEEQVIGTVPIGYADGFTRDMQGFSVLVDGRHCPVVGRVSMDQITVLLPNSYPLGTTVTLIGRDKEAVITVQDWADFRKTINYEVVCLLSDRIPRRYH